jgi:perosamine synthetase
MTEIIPPFKPEFAQAEINFVNDATQKILSSGRLVLGEYTKQFETGMAAVAQREYGVAVNSGSTALEIAYRLLDVKDRHVLVPTNTNFATAAAATYAGAMVELYDSGLYPDVDDLASRLRDDTASVTVVHIGGYISPEMEHIADICRARGVPLVEDAAHAHGALLNGRAAGSFSDIAAFSFFPTKVLTTVEGGMIMTDDAALAALARQYRDQGKHADGITHEVWGNSSRMTEMGAALGAAQLVSFERDAERRAEIIDRYTTELLDTGLAFPEVSLSSRPSGYKAIALLPETISRDGLKQAMLQRGVQLGKEIYEKPLHRQPVFEPLLQGDEYPVADEFAARHICLPVWRCMSDAQVTTVVAALRDELSR